MMTTTKKAEAGELRNRLATCNLADLGGPSCFLNRLSRTTGWSRAFSRGAIAEYLRYCELACTAGHQVSPGPVVDEVWHQHLLETRHYWLEFCPQVLGRELHHLPMRPGRESALLMTEHYAQTLRSYEQRFGSTPPAQFWPSWSQPAVRRFRRLRPHLSGLLVGLLPGSALAADGPFMPWTLQLVVFFMLSVATWLVRQCLKETGVRRDPHYFDPLSLAFLASGRWRAFDAAVASLLERDLLRVDGHLLVRTERKPDSQTPALARQIWQALPASLSELQRYLQEQWAEQDAQLRREQALHSVSAETNWSWLRLPWIIWTSISIYAWLDHPGVLGMFLTMGSVLACVLVCQPLRATLETRELIARLQTTRARLAQTPCTEEVPLAVALFGLKTQQQHPLLQDYVKLRAPGGSFVVEASSCSGCTDAVGCGGGGGDGGGGCGGD